MTRQPSLPSNPDEPDVAADATADDLMPAVYEQLRALASGYLRRETADQILEPAVLVNETYLKLAQNPPGSWTSREHFMSVAAMAMRKILIDHARRRRTLKRGFGRSKVSLDVLTVEGRREVDIRLIDAALRDLTEVNRRAGQIVELRFFAGLTHGQVAEVLGVSRKTVVADWQMAREWLARRLSEELAHHKT
ncbi:MAG: ECF-type sigma factor [Planctomycetota bacterium]